MNEQEQRDLARRLADVSEVLDFEAALRVVRYLPAKAEELLRMHKESEKRQEERARARERRELALLEFL
ncbi:MAG: hypothetical protein ACTHLH_05105 [Solirubrobacterales bacterium]